MEARRGAAGVGEISAVLGRRSRRWNPPQREGLAPDVEHMARKSIKGSTMSTYRSNKVRDVAIADNFLANFRPCTFCGVSTPYEDLAELGARCRPCFDRFCTQCRRYPTLSLEERKAMSETLRKAISGGLRQDGRQFVASLQARADAGERLTAGQRGFLEAVRRQLSVQEVKA